MSERVQTLHPEAGKQGVRIAREKYDLVRQAILEVLGEAGEAAFKELPGRVAERLEGRLQGSVSWYVTTVKLDLEARGLIERVPGARPQRLRLARKEQAS